MCYRCPWNDSLPMSPNGSSRAPRSQGNPLPLHLGSPRGRGLAPVFGILRHTHDRTAHSIPGIGMRVSQTGGRKTAQACLLKAHPAAKAASDPHAGADHGQNEDAHAQSQIPALSGARTACGLVATRMSYSVPRPSGRYPWKPSMAPWRRFWTEARSTSVDLTLHCRPRRFCAHRPRAFGQRLESHTILGWVVCQPPIIS
jgi:hypothetical protein